MVKKLFGSGRFSRQSVIRACFYEAKRAAKTSAKTVGDETYFLCRSLSGSQIA